MTNLRMNQNLQPQVQVSVAKLKVKPKENDDVKNLEKDVELVKADKKDPNEVLDYLGVKNVEVKNVDKNRQNLTFEVNGKRISVTGTSPEDLAAKAGKLLAEELENDQNGEPVKAMGWDDLIFLGIILLACWLKKKYPDNVDVQVR